MGVVIVASGAMAFVMQLLSYWFIYRDNYSFFVFVIAAVQFLVFGVSVSMRYCRTPSLLNSKRYYAPESWLTFALGGFLIVSTVAVLLIFGGLSSVGDYADDNSELRLIVTLAAIVIAIITLFNFDDSSGKVVASVFNLVFAALMSLFVVGFKESTDAANNVFKILFLITPALMVLVVSSVLSFVTGEQEVKVEEEKKVKMQREKATYIELIEKRIDDLSVKLKLIEESEYATEYMLRYEFFLQEIAAYGVRRARGALDSLLQFAEYGNFFQKDGDQLVSELLRLGKGDINIANDMKKALDSRRDYLNRQRKKKEA